MASLYADENVPFPLVDALVACGHDVRTALADGRAHRGIDDPHVLERATILGRCVLTNNRSNYHKLHRLMAHHAGILTYTTDDEIDSLAVRIHGAIASQVDLSGRLMRVIRPNPSRKTP